ncbi:hypothetical protein DL765_009365 [Monosporascus sp. GIB2]|nr:hypothetical protein DL765_009365 [Monosporascus sp. GIB2]
MSAPAFGFSVGDFISAIELIVKVSKALRDAGGVSEDYRSLVIELNLLQDVLAQLHSQRWASIGTSSSNNPFMVYAKQQTELTIATLSDFLNLISKFDAKLGSRAPTGWYRGIRRKAQWAIKYAEEVEKLRLRVGTQLHVLGLLVQLNEPTEILSSKIDGAVAGIQTQAGELAGMRIQSSIGIRALGETVERSRASQQSAHNALRRDTAANFNRQSIQLAQMAADAGNNFRVLLAALSVSAQTQSLEFTRLKQDITRNHRVITTQVNSTVPSIQPVLDSVVRKLDDVLLKLTEYQTNITRTIADLRDNRTGFSGSPEPEPGDRSHADVSTTLPIQPRASQHNFGFSHRTVGIRASDYENTIAGHEDDIPQLMLQLAIVRALSNLICYAWWFLQVLDAMAVIIRHEPMLLVSDSINFHDVLGREFTLQFEFYRYRPPDDRNLDITNRVVDVSMDKL